MTSSGISVQRIVPRRSTTWQVAPSPPAPGDDAEDDKPERKTGYGSKDPGTGRIVDRRA